MKRIYEKKFKISHFRFAVRWPAPDGGSSFGWRLIFSVHFPSREKEQKAYFKGILATQSPSRVKNLLQILHLYRRNIINQFLYPFFSLDSFPWQLQSLS